MSSPHFNLFLNSSPPGATSPTRVPAATPDVHVDASGEVVGLTRACMQLDITPCLPFPFSTPHQVQLAQLEYQLPRLTRMWTHLERQAGGMVKGMGEKQIEVDKRIIRERTHTRAAALQTFSTLPLSYHWWDTPTNAGRLTPERPHCKHSRLSLSPTTGGIHQPTPVDSHHSGRTANILVSPSLLPLVGYTNRPSLAPLPLLIFPAFFHQMAALRRSLTSVREHRQQHRDRRAGLPIPVLSLVGYTNAGKSTLLNRLTGAGVLAEDKLFATLDPTTRRTQVSASALLRCLFLAGLG
ncbi:unnamed protein product [Closterium sp. Naga37s-1]|nr:unnamed protein product [Closterium sp. Naga37s-1]